MTCTSGILPGRTSRHAPQLVRGVECEHHLDLLGAGCDVVIRGNVVRLQVVQQALALALAQTEARSPRPFAIIRIVWNLNKAQNL